MAGASLDRRLEDVGVEGPEEGAGAHEEKEDGQHGGKVEYRHLKGKKERQ